MVNNYTPNLKRRSDDVYSPGGSRSDRIVPRSSTRTGCMNSFPMSRLSSGVSKQACAGSPTMITGRTGCGSPSLPMPRQICSSSAWANDRWWRSPGGSQPGNPYAPSGISGALRIRWRLQNGAAPALKELLKSPGLPKCQQDKTAYARAFALHYHEQDPVRGRAGCPAPPEDRSDPESPGTSAHARKSWIISTNSRFPVVHTPRTRSPSPPSNPCSSR